MPALNVKPNTSELLPLDEYDYILSSYSGGKDSLACTLHLLDLGADPRRMELHHQHVDGEPGVNDQFMDWPVTEQYVKVTGEAFGLPVRFQWREGGFYREMMRKDSPTGPVYFQNGEGRVVHLPTVRANNRTRQKFPQKAMDLSVRWCSAYLKIDVFARAVNNDPRFAGKKVLVVTGERRQEGSVDKDGKAKGRAAYAEIERHRTSNQAKRVDAWRPVIDWSEEKIWETIRRHRVNPHPAYYLGWGRVSCLACIFGEPDQWASVREIAPDRFKRISLLEEQFGCTITRGYSVDEYADKGREFVSDKSRELVDLAMGRVPYTVDHFRTQGEWVLPAGAYKRCGGPI